MTAFQISLMILLFISFSLCLFTTIYAFYCRKNEPNSQVMNFIIFAILIISIISMFFAVIEIFI